MAQATQMQERMIPLADGGTVSSLWGIPHDYRGDALVLAPGAGSNLRDPLLAYLQEALTDSGVLVVTFNFPYQEANRKAPDRANKLEATWRTVLDAVRNEVHLAPARLFAGGRSMGGRIASHLAADGEPMNGLLLLAYPLRSANKPQETRTEHLPRIRCPVRFVVGSRDKMCPIDQLEQAMDLFNAPVTLQVIEQADHSFKLSKNAAYDEPRMGSRIAEAVDTWMAQEVR